ncbi:hypothetical protein ACKC9G_18655 [Pokkaliibacter sp. CJK22405]|uniref:hypothetical protein n=1 Tax=Pokkaliibacter sp. CJK22405 TaxID=3384615 RepID=UPI0039848704
MSQSDATHLVCLKWGSKYPAEYVNRLYRMVAANLTHPFTFHCLTESTEGLLPEINVLPLKRNDLEGWWYKLSLFQQDFYGLQGQIIYLDLDVVITANIDFLVEMPGDFVIIQNWSRNAMWNSSVMRFPVGKYHAVWESFLTDKARVLKDFHGDQEWIFACVPEAHVWPADKVVSYKKSLNAKAYPRLSKLKLPCFQKATDAMDTALTPGAAIVIFHGKPDPEDVADGPYGPWKKASFIQRAWSV